jgi:hypothetical protein
MKKSIILSMAITLIAAQAWAYKQQDLDMFKLLNSCEKCDLSEANLSKADLSGADLSGANLSGANLSVADLSGANLTDTDLTGANLKNIKEPKFCRTKTSIGVMNPDCRD